MRNAINIAVMLFFLTLPVIAQEEDQAVDLNYLEDQFYVGLTYNVILNKPADVNQQNLSYGLQLGFIKDLPLNSSRTFAIGVGLGYVRRVGWETLVHVCEGVWFMVFPSPIIRIP